METNKNELSGGMRALAIINCILMVAIGSFLFFNLRYIVLLFSVAVFVQGATTIIRYFGMKGARNGWDIIAGVVNILFGAVMLFGGVGTRVAGVLAFETFVAIWSLFAGFSNIFGSFGLKKAGAKNWIWTLLGGILLIICGIMFVSMPLMGAFVLVEMAGIYASISFVIAGLTGLAAALSSSGQQAGAE